jgi:hypothetical protein
MAGSYFRSGTIFFLRFGVDAEWELLETSVASQLLPGEPLQARGVWDLADALGRAELTLPLTITLTVTRISDETTLPEYVSRRLTADMTSLTVDTTLYTVDRTVYNTLIST